MTLINSSHPKEISRAGFVYDTFLDTFLILVFKKMRGHITGSLMAPPKTVTNGHEGGVARVGDWVRGGGKVDEQDGDGDGDGESHRSTIPQIHH